MTAGPQRPEVQFAITHQLIQVGWDSLHPREASRLHRRGEDVFLAERLEDAMRVRRFDHEGELRALPNVNILEAPIQMRVIHMVQSQQTPAEQFRSMLTDGIRISDTTNDGKMHLRTIPLVDWDHLPANTWEVSERPTLYCEHRTHRREPSLLAYVNGLPLIVFEVTDGDAHEAILRHLRNQQQDELPKLYAMAQLLVAVGKDAAFFGTARGEGWRRVELAKVAGVLRPERLRLALSAASLSEPPAPSAPSE